MNENISNVDTFFALGTLWLESHRIKIRESSYEKYATLLKKHIYPALGKHTLSDICAKEIDSALLQIYQKDGSARLSNSTMRTVLFLVKRILQYGYESHYIDRAIVPAFCIPVRKKRMKTFNEAEQETLLRHVLSQYTGNYLGILLALYTGARLGEICALQRSDVNFEIGVLAISKTVQRLQNVQNQDSQKTKLVVSAPKSTNSYREIPIPHTLESYMGNFGLHDLDGDQYLLTGTKLPYDPRTLQYGFSALLRKCNLPNYNFHTLRHTFATNCVRAGFDIKSLSELMGHSNVNFTLSQYVHSDIAYKKSLMLLLDQKMPNISLEC